MLSDEDTVDMENDDTVLELILDTTVRNNHGV